MASRYSDKYIKIGQRIAYYRRIKGMTQEELAYQAGISRSYISHIEAPGDSKTFSLDIIFVLADCLSIDVGVLLKDLNDE